MCLIFTPVVVQEIQSPIMFSFCFLREVPKIFSLGVPCSSLSFNTGVLWWSGEERRAGKHSITFWWHFSLSVGLEPWAATSQVFPPPLPLLLRREGQKAWSWGNALVKHLSLWYGLHSRCISDGYFSLSLPEIWDAFPWLFTFLLLEVKSKEMRGPN